MITEVTCSADLCTWGMSNIATKWNTDHLIGERYSHCTGCDTCWHVISLWKCTLDTCTGSSRLFMRNILIFRKGTFLLLEAGIKEMLHQSQFVAVLKFDTGPSPVSHLQITYNWNLKVFHTAIKYSSLLTFSEPLCSLCFIYPTLVHQSSTDGPWKQNMQLVTVCLHLPQTITVNCHCQLLFCMLCAFLNPSPFCRLNLGVVSLIVQFSGILLCNLFANSVYVWLLRSSNVIRVGNAYQFWEVFSKYWKRLNQILLNLLKPTYSLHYDFKG